MKKSFSQRIAGFMYGRYGVDSLYWFLFGTYVALWLLQIVLRGFGLGYVALVLSVLSLACLVFSFFRFFSKNIAKRRLECAAFLRMIAVPKGFFTGIKNRIRDRKTHVYKKCTHCKSTLRLPKKAGEHTVKCPRCGGRFDVIIK